MQGSELKAIREGLGWGQRRFAEELGMSQTWIGQMERGEKPIERRTELAARYLALIGEKGEA
jgi:transcriptional regulator with XRE-family HTH domain